MTRGRDSVQPEETAQRARIVAALGGNALLRRGESLEASVQRANVKRAATALAAVAEFHQLVVTHGNGPQIGLLALQVRRAQRHRAVSPRRPRGRK
jgi:carbamate kinase